MHLYSFVSDYAGYFLLHIQTRHLITHIKHIFLIRNFAKKLPRAHFSDVGEKVILW